MMTTKNIIDGITKWTEENICSKITLKVPDDEANDGRYTVSRVNPAAFPLYVPGSDRLPPNVPAPVPSVCVQLLEGSDNGGIRKMKMRYCLSVWTPGEHPGEKFYPQEDPTSMFGVKYIHKPEEERYHRNSDGWMELYNLQDIALSELHSAGFFEGVRIDETEPISFGPFTEEGAIWDYYPYWYGYITFTVVCGVPLHTNEEIREML